MNINKPGRLFMVCLRAMQFSPSWALSAPSNAAGSSGTDPDTAHRIHRKLLSQPRPPTETGTVPTYIDVVGVDVV